MNHEDLKGYKGLGAAMVALKTRPARRRAAAIAADPRALVPERRVLRLLDTLAAAPTRARDLNSYERPAVHAAEKAGLIVCDDAPGYLWRINER